jgi:hypothetical protein
VLRIEQGAIYIERKETVAHRENRFRARSKIDERRTSSTRGDPARIG